MLFQKKEPFFDSRVPAVQRIGPHRSEIYSLFYNTLLGDAYTEKHGFGTRLYFHQSSINMEFFMGCIKRLHSMGTVNSNIPKLGKHNKVYYSLKFRTWTLSSLNSLI